VLCAGLLGGATSPARPWFLTGAHGELMKSAGRVKDLAGASVTDPIRPCVPEPQVPPRLYVLYGEMGGFGTEAA
jgi:hypothetical protein